jgi:CyaY protein
MMDEKRFDRIGAEMLKKLERALTDLDDRMEADLGGDVLTVEFQGGRPFIINTHRNARQIWLSAELRAWHFSPDEATGRWVEPRDGSELVATLAELLGRKLGRPVALQVG